MRGGRDVSEGGRGEEGTGEGSGPFPARPVPLIGLRGGGGEGRRAGEGGYGRARGRDGVL